MLVLSPSSHKGFAPEFSQPQDSEEEEKEGELKGSAFLL